MRIRSIIPALLLTAAAASAGTIVTTDGNSYTGTLKRTEDGWTITQDDGKVQLVPARQVKTIELGGDNANKPGRDLAGLKSLQRSVEYSDDLPRIIQRYKTFIAQTKDAAVVQQAQADLATWQARLDGGMVKIGKAWGSPADRDAAIRRGRQKAELARQLIKDARSRDAEAVVAEILEADPQNVSALYLSGVLAQRRKELGDAKKQFMALQQLLPQHAPTLLNLALINFRQKQWAAANIAMEQALVSAPGTQVLLDTTAEFLNATPPELRSTRSAQQLAKTFFAQDAELQKSMAVRHLHRWGSTWVDDATFAQIQKANEEAKKKIDDLQKQFDETQAKITAADQRVAANEQGMRDIERNSYTTLSSGKLVRMPLPRAWYDLQGEVATLKAQQDVDRKSLESLRAEAVKARQTGPVPPYTGTLSPVGEDGVPLTFLPEDAVPTTRPASKGPTDIEPPLPAATRPAPPTTRPRDFIHVGPPDLP